MAGTGWKLTGKPGGTGECEHCGRRLTHRYEVTYGPTSCVMIVGRGCLKAVTGWTLTAAQAARELQMIGIRARRAANWSAFAADRPEDAATILADIAAYTATYPPHYGGGASHEARLYVEEGRADLAAAYLARRHQFAWTR